jgi:hypothetical protein
MNTKFCICLALGALVAVVAGCVETVDGRSQAGVPFVKDKVEGRYERPVSAVVEAARAVIKFNGQLVADNTVNNSMEAKINQEDVWVHVAELDPVKPVSSVVVQARKRSGSGDIELAHDIEKQIGLQLAGH